MNSGSSLLRGSALGRASSTAGHTAGSRCRTYTVAPKALFGGKKSSQKSQRELDREEAYRVQQEVLARRKSGSWLKEVEERRNEVRKYQKDPVYKEKVDSERRERRKKEKPDPEVNIFNIIIPIPPFGLPEYDDGERFDLRSPYAEKGYVDPEADFGKQVARFFGFGKKEGGSPDEGPKKGKNK